VDVSRRIMRVEDVLRKSFVFRGEIPTDAEINIQCPSCESWQVLTECTVELKNAETVYTCRSGCQRVVVVASATAALWPQRGLRFGPHNIHNAGDLTFMGVLVPASEVAIEARS
jgi:hypothetical protein